jgi:hypothetical protein
MGDDGVDDGGQAMTQFRPQVPFLALGNTTSQSRLPCFDHERNLSFFAPFEQHIYEASAEEFAHNLAWAGKDGRRQVIGVQKQAQTLVVNPAQMLVAGQKQPTVQHCGFGQDQGIMDFLGWEQTAAAKGCGHFIDHVGANGEFHDEAEGLSLAQQAEHPLRGCAKPLALAELAEKSKLLQDAWDKQFVLPRHFQWNQ